jgi:RNA polymerase sigma factor (sigma-70 family)
MVGFMYRMCHNPSTAEELAQEVFLRVYRSRTSYEPSAKFTTWLYRIATNLAVNHARDTRHERPENTVRLDEPDRETGTTPDLADDSLSAEEEILKRERLAAIRSKVNALPERQRVAVIMHKYQQMDYRQIAEVLKLSESATKSLLFRAYETLARAAERIRFGEVEESCMNCNQIRELLPDLAAGMDATTRSRRSSNTSHPVTSVPPICATCRKPWRCSMNGKRPSRRHISTPACRRVSAKKWRARMRRGSVGCGVRRGLGRSLP